MKAAVYNQEGEETGTVLLPKEIFEVKLNSDLVHQVAVSQMANKRKIIAHTKTRGEVSGGGKKPWRQKGLGRARHGSIRSPIWRKGGITFGPRNNRNFKKKINKKIRRSALFMVLSVQAKNNLLFVLDKFSLENSKTKTLVRTIENLRLKIKDFGKASSLIVMPKYEKNVILSARNVPGIQIKEARNLNALDLLSFKYLIMPKESIKVIKEIFKK